MTGSTYTDRSDMINRLLTATSRGIEEGWSRWLADGNQAARISSAHAARVTHRAFAIVIAHIIDNHVIDIAALHKTLADHIKLPVEAPPDLQLCSITDITDILCQYVMQSLNDCAISADVAALREQEAVLERIRGYSAASNSEIITELQDRLLQQEATLSMHLDNMRNSRDKWANIAERAINTAEGLVHIARQLKEGA